MIKYILTAILIVVADQCSKLFAVKLLTLHQPHFVFPGLNFTLAYNRGAAFSFLHDAGGWQRVFFSLVGIVAVVIIIFMLRSLKKQQLQQGIGLALILGGAIGNLIDRILVGQVTDFIDVYYKTWNFATFNLADVAISIGALLVILDAMGWFLPGMPKPGKS